MQNNLSFQKTIKTKKVEHSNKALPTGKQWKRENNKRKIDLNSGNNL